jgi:hypothetical protein
MLDLMFQDIRQREMLKDCDKIRERFVKGQGIHICRLDHAAMNAIENRMRHFMCDHIVGQTRKDYPSRKSFTTVGILGIKIPEQQRLLVRTVIRICLSYGVRVNPQPRNVLFAILVGFAGRAARRPLHTSAECLLEVANGRHGHRVNHLLMELRVPL